MGTSQPTVIPNPCVVTVIRAPASTPALGQATTLGVPTSATSSMEDTADLSNTFQQVHTIFIFHPWVTVSFYTISSQMLQ